MIDDTINLDGSKCVFNIRKIVQISTTPGNYGHNPMITALCDDGTIWISDSGLANKFWSKVVDIPQD